MKQLSFITHCAECPITYIVTFRCQHLITPCECRKMWQEQKEQALADAVNHDESHLALK